MKRLLIISLLIIGCQNDDHGNLSIFEDPSPEQFAEWVEVDSTYYIAVLPMVDLYKREGESNIRGNGWENSRFQLEYSELTWRGLYDYVNYYSDLYLEWGEEKTNKHLDSLNHRFEQFREDLAFWNEDDLFPNE